MAKTYSGHVATLQSMCMHCDSCVCVSDRDKELLLSVVLVGCSGFVSGSGSGETTGVGTA